MNILKEIDQMFYFPKKKKIRENSSKNYIQIEHLQLVELKKNMTYETCSIKQIIQKLFTIVLSCFFFKNYRRTGIKLLPKSSVSLQFRAINILQRTLKKYIICS